MSIFIKPKAVKITLLQRVMRLSTAAALKRCSYYKREPLSRGRARTAAALKRCSYYK